MQKFLAGCALALIFAFVPRSASAQPPAPTNLKAFPGGTSVALRWDSTSQAAWHRVYRDGTLVATKGRGFDWLFPEKDGQGYIDHGATAGKTYRYEVQAIAANGALSPKSAVLAVAFPAKTTPVPKVELDYSKVPRLKDWMETRAKPFLEIWYPKISDLLAYPDYTPPASFKIILDPAYTGLAQAEGNKIIRINPVWMEAHLTSLGLLAHEGTHILQVYSGRASWVTEGIADWVMDYVMRERAARPLEEVLTPLNGYSEAAYLFEWIERRSPGFVRALNINMNKTSTMTTDPDAVFRALARDTPAALWFLASGRELGMPLRFGGFASACVSGPPASGPATVAACNRTALAQRWTFTRQGSDLNVRIGNNCLDVISSGTANGSKVQLWWDCNGSGAQRWRWQANGTLRNPASGRCLRAPNGTAGTQLEIRDCKVEANQVLARPGNPLKLRNVANICVGSPSGAPMGGLVEAVGCDASISDQMWRTRSKSNGNLALMLASGECLDVRSSGTANGTPVQLWECNGSRAQEWRQLADGSLRNANSGRCLDATSGAAGSRLRIWDCTGSNGQRFALPDPLFADGYE